MGCWIGIPPGPGAAEACAAISMARPAVSTSTSRYPASRLLGLRERPVGDHWHPGPVGHDPLGLIGTRQPLGIHQLAPLDELTVEHLLNSMCARISAGDHSVIGGQSDPTGP